MYSWDVASFHLNRWQPVYTCDTCHRMSKIKSPVSTHWYSVSFTMLTHCPLLKLIHLSHVKNLLTQCSTVDCVPGVCDTPMLLITLHFHSHLCVWVFFLFFLLPTVTNDLTVERTLKDTRNEWIWDNASFSRRCRFTQVSSVRCPLTWQIAAWWCRVYRVTTFHCLHAIQISLCDTFTPHWLLE